MKLVKKIDIHVHTTEATWLSRLPSARYATPTELIEMYDQIGIEKGVILPNITVETDFHISSNYEIKNIVDKYPDRFAWFCNIDARQGDNSPETNFTPYIEVCKEHGAKGVYNAVNTDRQPLYGIKGTDPGDKNNKRLKKYDKMHPEGQ